MKAHRHILPHTLAALAALAALALDARADIIVPGANGSDGVLNITENTVIDLSLAPTGVWNTNTAASSPNFGRGTYDPAKWAVVFKYSSVSIRSNATVTFKNHPSRAPVVWLVSGNVVIDAGCVLSLDGQSGNSLQLLAEPGPGGFRGSGSPLGPGPVTSASGFGPGGGPGSRGDGESGFAGHGGTSDYWPWDGRHAPYAYNGIYGNPSLLPLIGGSGGGSNRHGNQGGGAGGGAILIAAQRTLNVSGVVQANGGIGGGPWDSNHMSGGGSGGGVRLIANDIVGGGRIVAVGGAYWYTPGPGRIRLERVSTDGGLVFLPASPSVVPLQSGDTAMLWVPDSGPSVRVISIGGKSTPTDPRAAFGATGADVSLAQTTSVKVIVETTNVENSATVRVRMTPRAQGHLIEREATASEILNESPKVIRWTVDMPVNGGYAAIQARVIRP